MAGQDDTTSALSEIQALLAAAGITDDASLQAALERDSSLQGDIEQALRRNPHALRMLALPALVEEFLAVEDTDQVVEFWRSVPTELEEPFIQVVAALLAEPPPDTGPVDLENLRARLDDFRRLCAQAQAAGATGEGLPPLAAALQAFTSARTWPDSQRVVEAHPELLSDAALGMLDHAIGTARSQGDVTAVDFFSEHADLLRRCRDVGIPAAFAEKAESGPEGDPSSAELSQIVEQLRRPADRTEMAQRAELCRQALALVSRESQPAFWAALQVELGNSLAQSLIGDRAENLERAIGAYEEALTVFEPNTLPVDCRRTARALARLAFTTGDFARCGDAVRLAIEANDALLKASMLRASKESELREMSGLASMAGYALGRLGRAAESAAVLEQGRARLLGEALEANRRELDALPEAERQLYRQAANDLERLRAAMVAPIPADLAAQPVLATRTRDLELAQAQLNEAITAIRHLPGYEAFFLPLTFEDIQAQTRQDRPLAYLATTAHGSVITLVWPDRVETLLSPFDESRLNSLLVETDGSDPNVIGGYLPAQMARSDWLSPALARLLPALGDLVAPLATKLGEGGARGVVVIPSGYLGLLPLHAAQYESKGTTRYFLDDFEITYAPSAQALAAAHRSAKERAAQPFHLAGVGNPLPLPDDFTPLDFAKAELQSIIEFLPDSSTTALYEHHATNPALLAAVGPATVVHLACHGTFAFDQPLNSGLQLSDGALTLGTVLDQPAPFSAARLAVLSACRSSVTDFNNLPDEAIGLPAGIMQAGVPAVVGTLWSVNDASTALLMVRYYELMWTQGLAPCQALGEAQRWLRDVTFTNLEDYMRHHEALAQARLDVVHRMAASLAHPLRVRVVVSDDPNARPFADPKYWAPFTYNGTTEVMP